MNIGFVSTWFERGAAYVTRAYVEALKDSNNVFVYARGGESYAKGDSKWDLPYVTWGYRLQDDKIEYKHFRKWISNNSLDIIFFNEQRGIEILLQIKEEFPEIKLGSYIDYYKEDTVSDFQWYDFLICNTKRHYSVFKDHPQSFYIPWGTDISKFTPQIKPKNKKITFFHSVGMSKRKGTSTLLDVYINTNIHENSNLIIHSQLDFEKEFGFSKTLLENHNVKIIEKTVTAPGLYHLGDVYVYPTTLDGLGLTLYEALSCGLPVITTNNGPMNEVINSNNGYLVEVEKYYSRSDGYYWPLSIVNEKSLLEAMEYYVNNFDSIDDLSEQARNDAVVNWNWDERKEQLNTIFNNVKLLYTEIDYNRLEKERKQKYKKFLIALFRIFPTKIQDLIGTWIINKK